MSYFKQSLEVLVVYLKDPGVQYVVHAFGYHLWGW